MFQTVLFAILTLAVGLIHWRIQRTQRQLDQIMDDADLRSPAAARQLLYNSQRAPLPTPSFDPEWEEHIAVYRGAEAFDRLHELFVNAPETIGSCSFVDYDGSEYAGELLAHIDRGVLICFRFVCHANPDFSTSLFRQEMGAGIEDRWTFEFTCSNEDESDSYRLYFKD